MVDEVLSTFQEELFGKYDEILAGDEDARTKLERAVRVSFEAIDQHPHEVAIFQNEADYLGGFDRFGYLAERNAQSRNVWMTLLTEGVETGVLRPDLDIELTYRFIRDTVWVAVRWYRPGESLGHDDIADQYLHILLDGICQCLRPTSSTPSARRSGSAAARSPRCTRPTSPRTRWTR